jgi:hypothetical protein
VDLTPRGDLSSFEHKFEPISPDDDDQLVAWAGPLLPLGPIMVAPGRSLVRGQLGGLPARASWIAAPDCFPRGSDDPAPSRHSPLGGHSSTSPVLVVAAATPAASGASGAAWRVSLRALLTAAAARVR